MFAFEVAVCQELADLFSGRIDTRWSRDEIKVLPVLLHEAKTAGRTVVMISDHGHILDCHAKGQSYEGGERWRKDEGSPTDGELRIKGPRVLLPESKTLIAPWTERVRYGIKKNGYHGGVSLQEMVIPIAVLNGSNDFPSGWVEATVDLPTWWDVSGGAVGGDEKPLSIPKFGRGIASNIFNVVIPVS